MSKTSIVVVVAEPRRESSGVIDIVKVEYKSTNRSCDLLNSFHGRFGVFVAMVKVGYFWGRTN